MATALGLLGMGGTGELVERLCSHLRERRALLILDNCEHLVEACARLVLALLANCPGVVVLATSRETLGLSGEVAWRVPPLSLPGPGDLAASDAMLLFSERAGEAQPGFALTPANAASVAQICRRLDGIPLAIELAAARVRVLSTHQLADRLDRRFSLLTGGDRTVLPRHQTLRATMDWSYDLLPTDEAALLRRLAVFPAGFDLVAVEAVGTDAEGGGVDPDPGLLDRFSHLADKSLVVIESEGASTRYRLLETVKEYSLTKLTEAGELEATRRRHQEFFLRSFAANETDPAGTFDDEWMARCEADYESLRAALSWSVDQDEKEAAVQLAAALIGYWTWSRPVEGADLLGRVFSTPPPPTPAAIWALANWGVLLHRSGRISAEGAEEVVQGALDLALAQGHEVSAASARLLLGELRLNCRDLLGAAPLLREALRGLEMRGSQVTAGWCHHSLGWLGLHSGDVASARRHFEEARELARKGQNSILGVHVLTSLGPLAALAGETEAAGRMLDEALESARGSRLQAMRVMALARAAEVQVLSGAASGAEPVLRELVGALRDLGTRAWVDDALEMMALVAEERGAPHAAARLLGGCRALRLASGERGEGRRRILSAAVEGCQRRLAEALGPVELAEQEALGRGMSVPEALSFALE